MEIIGFISFVIFLFHHCVPGRTRTLFCRFLFLFSINHSKVISLFFFFCCHLPPIMKSKWDLILCVVVCIVCDVCVVGKCVAAIIRQRNKAAPLLLRNSLSQTLFLKKNILFIDTEDNLRFSKIPNVPAVYT